MRIKKFQGKSFQEAYEKMKKELGEEAIILNSRTIKPSNGLFDIFSDKGIYEITAAIDPAPASQNAASRQPAKGNGRTAGYPGYTPPQKKPHTSSVSTPRTVPTNGGGNTDTEILKQLGQITELKDEIKDIKKVLNQVADFLKYSRMPALPETFKTILKELVDNEVHEDLSRAIVQTVYAHTDAGDYDNQKVVTENLMKLITRMIKIGSPLEDVKRTPYVVTLVGPTGVGKTTTIAKIAANAKLYHQKKVALISADTYRIAAIEQLQTFANIANIPMSVAYSPEEIREAIYKYREKDLILIDTVGRSQKNEQHLKDLYKFVDTANPDEVMLVLSLTSSLKTLLDIIRRFSIMKPNRFVFSKLDEATNTGNIINVLYKHQLPVSYLTTGQTVPNDIMRADKEILANLIYKGVLTT